MHFFLSLISSSPFYQKDPCQEVKRADENPSSSLEEFVGHQEAYPWVAFDPCATCRPPQSDQHHGHTDKDHPEDKTHVLLHEEEKKKKVEIRVS